VKTIGLKKALPVLIKNTDDFLESQEIV